MRASPALVLGIAASASACSLLDFGALDRDAGPGAPDSSASKSIAVVGTTQFEQSGATSVALPLPSKAAPGDLVILIVQALDGASVTAPAGFTSEAQPSGSCGGYTTTFLAGVVAGADLAAGYSLPLSHDDSVDAVLTDFRGAAAIQATNISIARVDADPSGHMQVAPVSVSDPSDVQWLGVSSVYQSATWGAPAGMTLVDSVQSAAVFTSTGLDGGTTGPLVVGGPDETGGCGATGLVDLSVAK